MPPADHHPVLMWRTIPGTALLYFASLPVFRALDTIKSDAQDVFLKLNLQMVLGLLGYLLT